MSRLQVDNILIEGQSVRIATDPVQHRQAQARPTNTASLAIIRWVQRLPISSGTIVFSGVAIFAVGLFLALNAHSVGRAVVPSLGMIALLLAGGVLMGSGIAKWILGRSSFDIHRLAVGDRADEMLDRLASRLALAPEGLTIEAIVRDLGWNEVVVAHLLAILRDRDELAEDLDEQSENFVYRVLHIPRDLDTRLDTMSRRRMF
jgi:hypothetical protein